MTKDDYYKPIPPYSYWESHPDFPVDRWQHEVYNDFTRLGYWPWVREELSDAGDEN